MLAGSSIVNKSSGSSFLPGSSSFIAGAGSAAGPGWGPGVSKATQSVAWAAEEAAGCASSTAATGAEIAKGSAGTAAAAGAGGVAIAAAKGSAGGAGEAWAWAAGVGAGVSSPKATQLPAEETTGAWSATATGAAGGGGVERAATGAAGAGGAASSSLPTKRLVSKTLSMNLLIALSFLRAGGGRWEAVISASGRGGMLRAKALPKENVTDWNRSLDLSLCVFHLPFVWDVDLVLGPRGEVFSPRRLVPPIFQVLHLLRRKRGVRDRLDPVPKPAVHSRTSCADKSTKSCAHVLWGCFCRARHALAVLRQPEQIADYFLVLGIELLLPRRVHTFQNHRHPQNLRSPHTQLTLSWTPLRILEPFLYFSRKVVDFSFFIFQLCTKT